MASTGPKTMKKDIYIGSQPKKLNSGSFKMYSQKAEKTGIKSQFGNLEPPSPATANF